MKSAATNSREFRNFLLMSQFEAREIGARIARARKEAGLRQEDLAAAAGFSTRSLQDYESGAVVPWAHLVEISSLLKKPKDWFIHGEQPPPGDWYSRLLALEEKVDQIVEIAGGGQAKSNQAFESTLKAFDRLDGRFDDVGVRLDQLEARLSEIGERLPPPGRASQAG